MCIITVIPPESVKITGILQNMYSTIEFEKSSDSENKTEMSKYII